MKVCIFGANDPPGLYSGGRYLSLIMAYALARAGVDVTYVTNFLPPFDADFARFDTELAVRKVVSETFSPPAEMNADWIIVIPSSRHYDFFFEAIEACAVAWKARIALLSFETPNWFNAIAEEKISPLPTELWRRPLRHGGLVVSIAETGVPFARDFFSEGNETDGLQYGFWHPPINDMAANAIAPFEGIRRRVVAFVRTEDIHKGAQDLLRLDPAVLAGHVLSLVFGRGIDPSYLAAVRRHFGEAGVTVEARSKISDLEKFELLESAALLLFPSYFEGFGYPPVEVAWMGVPIVAYNLPVIRETIGDAAVYVPAGDTAAFSRAIATILANKSAGARSRTARHAADTRSAGQALRQLLEQQAHFPTPRLVGDTSMRRKRLGGPVLKAALDAACGPLSVSDVVFTLTGGYLEFACRVRGCVAGQILRVDSGGEGFDILLGDDCGQGVNIDRRILMAGKPEDRFSILDQTGKVLKTFTVFGGERVPAAEVKIGLGEGLSLARPSFKGARTLADGWERTALGYAPLSDAGLLVFALNEMPVLPLQLELLLNAPLAGVVGGLHTVTLNGCEVGRFSVDWAGEAILRFDVPPQVWPLQIWPPQVWAHGPEICLIISCLDNQALTSGASKIILSGLSLRPKPAPAIDWSAVAPDRVMAPVEPGDWRFSKYGYPLHILGRGWSVPDEGGLWNDGPSASVRLDEIAVGDRPVIVALEGETLVGGQVAVQRAGLAAGELPVADIVMPAALKGAQGVVVPPARSGVSCGHLIFDFTDAEVPARLGINADDRLLGLMLSRLSITPASGIPAVGRKAVFSRNLFRIPGGTEVLCLSGNGPCPEAIFRLNDNSVFSRPVPSPDGWQAWLHVPPEQRRSRLIVTVLRTSDTIVEVSSVTAWAGINENDGLRPMNMEIRAEIYSGDIRDVGMPGMTIREVVETWMRGKLRGVRVRLSRAFQ